MKVLMTYPQIRGIATCSAQDLGCVLGLGWEECICVVTSIHVSVCMHQVMKSLNVLF